MWAARRPCVRTAQPAALPRARWTLGGIARREGASRQTSATPSAPNHVQHEEEIFLRTCGAQKRDARKAHKLVGSDVIGFQELAIAHEFLPGPLLRGGQRYSVFLAMVHVSFPSMLRSKPE